MRHEFPLKALHAYQCEENKSVVIEGSQCGGLGDRDNSADL